MRRIRREAHGEKWSYLGRNGRALRDKRVLDRLNRLAVPPAYTDVLYAADPKAHLQAVGRDAAGRLQYRYHSDWEKIREIRKAERLVKLAEALPRIRRAINHWLEEKEISREFVLAAVIALIDRTAIRAGDEQYAKERGTRGAATLLKSNVHCEKSSLTLSFRAKGGKQVQKETVDERLCDAISKLKKLPGKRLFQYPAADGSAKPVTASEVNIFLREIAGCHITLKDFRTLCGTTEALCALAALEPGESQRARKKQVKEAIALASQSLANTPTVCRKSYVHPAILTAFENGMLKTMATALAKNHTAPKNTKAMIEVIQALAA